jgi:AAA ATPase domain
MLDDIYNSFDPFQPLQAGNPAYVDCREVRGDGDILAALGNKIRRQKRTCQLYAGHRGGGKSTELLRLEESLKKQGCFVIYFDADRQDIDPEDVQYTDILLACTRAILEKLKDSASPEPLLNWLKSRWGELKDLLLTEISLESLEIEAQILQFAKLTANLRAIPTLRHQIRQRVDPHTPTLIEALNQFITDAKKRLPKGYSQLVVIADSLDRIVPITQEDGRTNHDNIFIDRSGQLKSLDCHIIYTVPISMVHSNRASDLRDIYGSMETLPMIMVCNPDNSIYEPGINKIKELITKRIQPFDPKISLAGGIFDTQKTLEELCLMSGGHVRNLLLLIQSAIDHTETLPISGKAVRRAISEARETYRKTVDQEQYPILSNVLEIIK